MRTRTIVAMFLLTFISTTVRADVDSKKLLEALEPQKTTDGGVRMPLPKKESKKPEVKTKKTVKRTEEEILQTQLTETK